MFIIAGTAAFLFATFLLLLVILRAVGTAIRNAVIT